MLGAILKIQINEKLEDTILLKPGRVVIGREDVDVIINHPEVSCKHCQIAWRDGHFQLFDLHSTNGTFLNGQRIVKAKLKNGDSIALGRLKITFVIINLKEGYSGPHLAKIKKRASVPFHKSALSYPEGSFRLPATILNSIEEIKFEISKVLQLILTFSYEDGSTEVVKTRGNEVILGRASPLGRLSTIEELSRTHAKLLYLPSGLLGIQDLASTNGTYLNNIRVVDPVPVMPTDIISFGKVTLQARVLMVSSP